jgi:uncharacterized protein (TIGR02453 family)
MVSDPAFTPALFTFLRDLRANNDRDWFNANKPRYERSVKEPGLEFIADFEPYLHKISPRFVADPRANGGSMFRIYRDTRFSKDKTPYKTNTGFQFRHERGKDAHAPGFYLHLEPGQVFAGAGLWRPETPVARKIRDAIVADPARWKRVAHGKRFRDVYTLEGDSLQRPPTGYDRDHPLVDDLRRKDFIGSTTLTQKTVTSPGFLEEYYRICKAAAPFMEFLCDAVGVPF